MVLNKDKCIVFDLDRTLVCTLGYETIKTKKFLFDNKISSKRIYRFPEKCDGKEKILVGVIRPGTKELIQWCKENMRVVVIWSAGKEEYVQNIVSFLFTGEGPDVVWSRRKCLVTKEYGNYSTLITAIKKPLENLINEFKSPEILNNSNTIIVDDNPDYISFNDIENYYYINPYIAGNINKDNHLFDLQKFISSQEYQNTPDVKNLNFSNLNRYR